jgi:holo-[acyl-carrier protein] synthase
VDVPRFAALLELRGALLTERVFTRRELAACRGDPARLAARFAAKEAAAKALGTGIGPVAWRDVEVRTGPDGAPRLALAGAAARLARRRGLRRWAVSLAHDGHTAIGVVVADRGRP